jgi:L-iditol 2-dehydrogenase
MVGIKPAGMTGIIGNGPVGLGVQIITQAMGSRTIVIGNSARLGLSLELGAAHVFDYRDGNVIESVKKVTDCCGVDQVFDCAGTSHSMNSAISICRRGGRIGLIAVPPNCQTEVCLKAIMWDELSVIGSRGNPNCHDAILSMIAEKQINPQPMITHRYPIERFSEAIQVVQNRLEQVMKVIITIN